MSEQAGGTGAAHDASVIAVSDIGELEAALATARAAAEAGASERRIGAARAKIDRAQADLAAAEEALEYTIVEERERAIADDQARADKAARKAAAAAEEGN